MGSSIVFWIVIGCLIFSLCESLWLNFQAIRESETKQDVNHGWCAVVNNVFVYTAFITLYATKSLGDIYFRIYEYFYWDFAGSHFIWSEGLFLLAVVLIWIVASLPALILRIITTTSNTGKIIRRELAKFFYMMVLIPLGIGYMFLIEVGTIWSLVPFLLGILPLGLSITDATNNFRHTITWRMMLWTASQAIIVLGVGIMARELMGCWQLSEAMGLYDYSYAANLISIVIIGSVIVEFLFAADEHFKPKMYIPMSPSDIDEWKEKHQAELAANEEEENKANADTEVKDE